MRLPDSSSDQNGVPAASRPDSESDPGKLDQVRDILLGPLIDSVERRFDRLEDGISELRREAEARANAIEMELRRAVEELSERAKRDDADLGDRLTALGRTVEENLNALRSDLARDCEKIRAAKVDRASLGTLLQRVAEEVARAEEPEGGAE